MKLKNIVAVLAVVFMLASCTPAVTIAPTKTVVPTITPVESVESLIEMIYVSDPTLPQYDPNAAAYSRFPEIVQQLGNMGIDGIDAASDLAVAIRFPRQDSYLAAQALLKMGAEITITTVPVLVENLHSPNPDTRIYSVILLASVGKPSSCAIGKIAPLLWDSDASVRASAALAIEKITEQDFVASEYKIQITPSLTPDMIFPDTPEGKVVEKARNWWNEQGSMVNWHSTYGTCDP
jgi:hypothetical protein